VLPAPLLYIFGAGHVALELFKAARNAGFDVIVADDREAYANAERFPQARQVIALDFDEALAGLTPNESSYIVIATRGHRDDMRILRWAVQSNARYIGMVGSRRKAITVFRELTAEGLKPELFDRVHSPVGIDIGAITPEEIAVSIVAELIALRRHAERLLPHMTWLHGNTSGATDKGNAGVEDESPVAGTGR
jgi:xanthine dehydrogenase accessory factor